MSTGSISTTRLYYLDWLRILAFSLLVFYHAGLIFVDWGFHIQNDEFSEGMKLPMLFLNQWRLPLLFFVSGAGIRFALGRRSKTEFLRERFTRLFIPLVFGILVVVPPQSYFELMSRGRFEGNYLEFYIEYYLRGNLTWNHLWFLAYLIAFIVMTLSLFSYLRKEHVTRQLDQWLQFFAKPLRLLLLVFPLLMVEIFLRDRWPDNRNLVSDWYNFAFYLTVYIYGFVMAQGEFFWSVLERDRHWYLAIALFSFWMIYLGWHQPGKNFLEQFNGGYLLFRFFKCLDILTMVLACVGFARRYLNFNSTLLQYANKAVYPFYILHQTVLIAIGYYVLKMDAGILPKYALIVSGTFLIALLLYDVIILRLRMMKILFGVK